MNNKGRGRKEKKLTEWSSPSPRISHDKGEKKQSAGCRECAVDAKQSSVASVAALVLNKDVHKRSTNARTITLLTFFFLLLTSSHIYEYVHKQKKGEKRKKKKKTENQLLLVYLKRLQYANV